ncbi:MAG TPA: Spy/CpxP family protein refolding chaperone [Thermoanaerobaculia bacterium]|nr:Spy/CpxP family protein refolding chaperone [Thermoanaerobaculia bacterium]
MKRLIVLTLSLILAGSVFAQPRRGPAGNNKPLAIYLGLTAGQQAAWETMQAETRAALGDLRERDLADQLESATDATTIGNVVLQLRDLSMQIEAARDAAQAKFTATLTAEQQTKFAAFQAATEFLQRRGPGGPPPPPRNR